MPIQPGIELKKEEVLKRISEEQIFEKYLQLPVDETTTYHNPLRVDKRAGCRYYRGRNGRLYFKDFSKGYHWDCFNVVEFIYNCSFIDALKIIIQDFQLNKEVPKRDFTPEPIEKNRVIIQITAREWNNQDIEYWGKYNINLSHLGYFRVYPCKAVWINREYYQCRPNDPCYAFYFGKINNVDIFKLYFPLREYNRFFQNVHIEDNILQGFNQLQYKSDTLVITKSLKDVICLTILSLESVAPVSEYQIITQEQFDFFKSKYKHIVVLGDNDETGRQFIIKHAKKYNISHYLFPKSMGKDISDNISLYGINRIKSIVNEKLLKL